MKHEVIAPRRLVRVWFLVRDGLPSVGRYRRYLVSLLPALAAVWTLTFVYLAVAPTRYTSSMTLILPGSGVGGTMNVDSIGQATTVTSSAFSSATLSPTENDKRLLMADVTLHRAAALAREKEEAFPKPTIKLVDQTNLIEVTMTGGTARQAQHRMVALQRAFLGGLDTLREDEARKRETADRARIGGLKAKVSEAQRRLLQFQGATGLVSLEQFNARISALDTLHDRERLARTTVNQQEAGGRRLGADLRISTAGARQAFLLKADPIFQSLLSRYAAVAVVNTETGATLGPQHAVMEQLDAERTSLRTALVDRGRALTGLSPSTLMSFADLSVAEGRARMLETMVTSDSQTAGANAALEEIRRQIAEQNGASAELVQQASMLADLGRDARVAEAVFSSALARVDTNKADPFASYPLVQTFETPSLPKARSSPSVKLALAGAAGASLMIVMGFGLIWLRQPIIHKLLPKA